MSNDRRMDKQDVICIYVQWNIAQPLKKWNNAIWSNMDGLKDIIMPNEVTEKDKYHVISLKHRILKNNTDEST